jgi:hypothetical protein
MKANIVYNGINRPTVDLLVKVGKEKFDIDFKIRNWHKYAPTICCGKDDDFTMNKKQTLEYLKDIMYNTILTLDVTATLDKNTVVVVKNPTRIMLFRDVIGNCYRYIVNKSEWRINISYGKVNQILNKNIRNEPFGKADLTQWTPEEDKKVRKTLIDYAKNIYTKINKDYPRIEHFGLDIIRNNDDNKYYLLELNRANGLNEESCEYLLNGFVQTYGGNEDG